MRLNLVKDLDINGVSDLYKLGILMDTKIIDKINLSQIGRELNKDTRTIKRWINFKPEERIEITRNKPSQFDEFKDLILELLDSKIKVFSYKRNLYKYLVDNYNMKGSESSFRAYIIKNNDINDKFKRKNSKATPTVRFETEEGKQAQVDWKESIKFKLKNGDDIEINIFTYILAHSRYRVNILSLSKRREIILDFLDKSFEITGGIPKEILFDNMKTVMDEPRSYNKKGKVNDVFLQFAKDYGFKVNICMSRRPETKGKVEATMKVLEQIKAYSGDLDYDGLLKLVEKINNEENMRFHSSYQKIPVKHLEKEKAFLAPLPNENIRKQYIIPIHKLKVDKSSLITFKSIKYSVDHTYIDKIVNVQLIGELIYIYCNTKLITMHPISKKNINYHEQHFKSLSKRALKFDDERIENMANNNLKMIGVAWKKQHMKD